MPAPRDKGDWLALALGGVTLAAVIAGFFIVGGPGRARDLKLDARRLEALTQTAAALGCYRRGIGPLPESITDARAAFDRAGSAARLADGCAGAEWVDDPVTGTPFEIERAGVDGARLCADFLRPAVKNEALQTYWLVPGLIDTGVPRPDAGRFCYPVNLAATPEN
jgi:hypothetical protein